MLCALDGQYCVSTLPEMHNEAANEGVGRWEDRMVGFARRVYGLA